MVVMGSRGAMATLTRWMFGGLAVAVAALFAASGGGAAHAQAGPTFVLSPQTQTVDLSAGTVQVQVDIQNAVNMTAFQFVLRYDPGVLSQPNPTVGPLLGSTGLSVQCLPPIVDGASGPGTVQFACLAGVLGAPQVTGSGNLATVTFRLAGGASTAVVIEQNRISNANGDYLCPGVGLTDCPAQDGSIIVTGGNPALDRGLSPTPTPAPVAVATAVPIGGAPVSGTTPAPAGAGDAGASSAGAAAAAGGAASRGTGAAGAAGAPSGTIAGASSGALSSGGAAGAAGSGAPGSGGAAVGKFGFGPPPASHQHDRRDAIIAALALAALGLVLLRAAAAVRPRM